MTPDHSTRAHHPTGPSKINYLDPRVGGCPGFRQDDGSSEAAEEGTACHEIVDAAIRQWLSVGGTISQVAESMRNWDDDTAILLAPVWQFLEERLAPGLDVYVEPKVQLRRKDGSEINFGSLDLLLVRGASATLVDWKFGFLPVPSADENRQGWNYAAAVFQALPVTTVTVEFVQPRRGSVSSCTFSQHDPLAEQIDNIIANSHDETAPRNPGKACTYCNRKAACPAYLQKFQLAVFEAGMDIPVTLNLDVIDTPEKAAIAREWVSFLEMGFGPIKAKVQEIALANGGRIAATVGDRTIAYKMVSKGLNREVGDAVQVASALSNFVEPTQILGAAELSLGKLEEIVVPAIQQNSPEKMTKKAAKAALHAILEAQDLLTRPDGQVQFLKREAETKEICSN